MTDQLDDVRTANPRLGEPVLDNPTWASLTGPHARFAEINGQAGRYQEDVAGFVALADPDDPAAWRDLLTLLGPGREFGLSGAITPPPGWEILLRMPGVQFVDTDLRAEPDPEAVRLGAADVPEMLDSLLPRIAPAQAVLGDVMALEGEGGIGAICICAGPRRAFGWFEGEERPVMIEPDMAKVVGAWRA